MFTKLNLKTIHSSLRYSQRILSYSTKWKQKLSRHQQEINKYANTEEWRNAVKIIDQQNLTCTKFNLPVFNSLAQSAFYENDKESGWKLLNKISKSGFEPNNQLFKSYWKLCTQNHNQFHATIEEMLEFIANNRILLHGFVLEDLEKSIDSFGGIIYKTRVDYENGLCEQCSGRINAAKLSLFDRSELKKQFEKAIMKPVVKPGELQFFKGFISPQTKKFRYIIDALNVTRIGTENKGNIVRQGNILIELIEKLLESGAAPGNILTIGKKHIKEWPEHVVNYVQTNTKVFLTNNDQKSVDDIFMMYAAIVSGEKVHFITNDRLSEYPQYFDKKTQEVFKNWQNQHQLIVSFDGKEENIKLNKIFQHRAVKDIENSNWHIPYVDGSASNFELYNSKLPIKWACIQFSKNKENEL